MNVPRDSESNEGIDRPEKPEPDKATLDRIFGEVLPETTRDERDFPDPSADPADWYLRNRPPHHGD